MGFGIRLRALWRFKAGLAVSLLLALTAAVWSLDKISLFPPGLTPRALEMAAASTQVVVDTPRSTILDLRQDTYRIEGLTNRGILLGNVMASPPVRASIARRADVPLELLRVAPPLTPQQPRATPDAGSKRGTADILKSNDQYRLTVVANPTVPVVYIYAQTPDAQSAGRLANAAVDALRAHLSGLATAESTPPREQIQLVQLGRARGAVINDGIEWQTGVFAFLVTLAVSCATLVLFSRVREGWRLAALSERAASG